MILCIGIALFANSYDFNEFKYVSAVSTYFKKSGHIQVDKNKIIITFKADLQNQISKAIVKTKDKKVISFKMFMPNKDTLEIVKK